MPKANDEPSPQTDRDRQDYLLLDRLDRLEELLEEMADLGVTTREDIERHIQEIESELDDLSNDP